MEAWCLKCEKSIPENEADSAYCFDCTTLIHRARRPSVDAQRSDWSPSASSRSQCLAEGSSSDVSYETTNSDYESLLATTIPSDSDPECIEDCTPQLLQHPLYQASPRFLAVSKSPPARLKASLLLPMPSAPILASVRDGDVTLTPSDEPLSLPTSLPFFSSTRTATALLESAQELNRSRIARRNTDSDGRRPLLPRFGKVPSREAVTFYLNSEDEEEDEVSALGDVAASGRLKRNDSGIRTPTRPRSIVGSLSRLNLAADSYQREGGLEMRRGRSREVSKRASYSAEKVAKPRQASSGSSGSREGRRDHI